MTSGVGGTPAARAAAAAIAREGQQQQPQPQQQAAAHEEGEGRSQDQVEVAPATPPAPEMPEEDKLLSCHWPFWKKQNKSAIGKGVALRTAHFAPLFFLSLHFGPEWEPAKCWARYETLGNAF